MVVSRPYKGRAAPVIRLLTPPEAAAFLQVHFRTLENWRADGSGPPFVRAGHQIRYPIDGLVAWLMVSRFSKELWAGLTWDAAQILVLSLTNPLDAATREAVMAHPLVTNFREALESVNGGVAQ